MTARTIPISSRIKQAATEAASLAKLAGDLGTFAVGGVLVSDDGQILARSRNRVLSDGRVNDPTAHVERQLVDWIYEQRAHGKAIPAGDHLTIISSLEPCMMCAGAILSAGIRCVAIAEDSFAGLGVGTNCNHLPGELQAQARQSFFLFRIDEERAISTAEPPGEFNVSISKALHARASQSFVESLSAVRDAVALKRPITKIQGTVEPDNTIQLNLSPSSRTWIPIAPDQLYSVDKIFAQLGGINNSLFAALTTRDGQVLCASVGEEHRSPIRTSVVEVIRAFIHGRLGPRRAIFSKFRPSDLHLLIRGKFSSDAQMVCSLGAIGSFLEGPLPSDARPYIRTSATENELRNAMNTALAVFPPFYSTFVGLSA